MCGCGDVQHGPATRERRLAELRASRRTVLTAASGLAFSSALAAGAAPAAAREDARGAVAAPAADGRSERLIADPAAYLEALGRRSAFGEIGNIIERDLPAAKHPTPDPSPSKADAASGRVWFMGSQRVTKAEADALIGQLETRHEDLTRRLSRNGFYDPVELMSEMRRFREEFDAFNGAGGFDRHVAAARDREALAAAVRSAASDPTSQASGLAEHARRLFFEDDAMRVPSSRNAVLRRLTAVADAVESAGWRNAILEEGWTPAAILDRARREGLPLDELGPHGAPEPRQPEATDAQARSADTKGGSADRKRGSADTLAAGGEKTPARYAPPKEAPDLTAQRADVERALAGHPDLPPIELAHPDGRIERVAARDLLDRVERMKTAAAELAACIVGGAA